MPPKKAIITDYVWPNIDVESEVLRAAEVEPVVAPDTSESTLAGLAADADVIMFCFAQVTGNVLKSAEKCKVASRYGIGVDNIDIATATELGIVVTNIPDYCMDEVTDHAIGMILGYGRIGRAIADKAAGFGMNIIAYDPLIEHIDPDHYNDMCEAITNAHRDQQYR